MAVLFSAAAAYSGLKIGQVFEAGNPDRNSCRRTSDGREEKECTRAERSR